MRQYPPLPPANSDDSYEDGGFEAPKTPKTTTVTRMATLPVTVDTFVREGWGGYHGGGGVERNAFIGEYCSGYYRGY